MQQKPGFWQRYKENRAKRHIEKLNQKLNQLVFSDQSKLPHEQIALQVQNLVESGANINYQGNGKVEKTSVLMQAIITCNHQLVQYLVSNGADVNLADNNGTTPLLAATTSFEGVIPKLLAHGANVNAQDKRGLSPLMQAAKNNNLRLVSYLLLKGAKPNLTDQHKQSALFYSGSNYRITQTLLEQGADPKLVSLSKMTPLFTAQDPKAAELLLRYGSDVNHRDFNRRTPLMVMANHPNLVKVLLQYGANPTLCDSEKDTALHFAQNPQSITLLVEAGADIDAQGSGKKTPLLCLAENPYTTPETLNALLQYGPKPFNYSVWLYTCNQKLQQILIDYQHNYQQGIRYKPHTTRNKRLKVSFTPETIAQHETVSSI